MGFKHSAGVARAQNRREVVGFLHRFHQHGEIGHAALQHRAQAFKAAGQQRQPVANQQSTSFDQRVYALVAQIPPGRLATYGQIAELLGCWGCARQVGWALRRLPLPSAVPWQRVVNASGRISFSPAREGSDWMQRQLLIEEGIPVSEQGALPLRRYLWTPELPISIES